MMARPVRIPYQPPRSLFAPATAPATSPSPTPPRSPLSNPPQQPQQTSAHEQLWTTMQQKLSEVELSTSIFFGPAHAESLAALRKSQVLLAQAWIANGATGGANGNSTNGEEHFARVKRGVEELGGRLEGVREAMGRVRAEAGGVWEDGDGPDGEAEEAESESESGSVVRRG